MLKRSNQNTLDFKKGELVLVRTPQDKIKKKICMIVSVTVPCIYGLNEYFMVYSIIDREKFITVNRFMTKMG